MLHHVTAECPSKRWKFCTDVVLEHCCHCYDNLGLRMCFWTKDTRSCSSHGQSDYLRSSFSTKKEYSNLSSKIQKVDCNTNSAMVFNLGSLRPVTRTLLVSCTSPGVNLWRYESFQDLWENHCFFYGLARRYRQLFWEDSASISTYLFMHWIYLFTMDGWRKLSTSILLEQTRR